MMRIGHWVIGMGAALLLIGAGWAHAQAPRKEIAKPPAVSKPPPSPKSAKERRIVILGTTIVGSVAKPRAVYEVPWKEPEAFKKGQDEPYRSFQDEIFTLIDKEQFESQIGSD